MSEVAELPVAPEPAKRERARVNLVVGDITEVPSDVLLTSVTSSQSWNGAVDKAIMHKFGSAYHHRLTQKGNAHGLTDGEVVYIHNFFAVDPEANQPPFGGVAFVVDDLKQGLDEVVSSALTQLNEHHSEPRSVTIPLMRTGSMAGKHESPLQAVANLSAGIHETL